jgi:hypothetical protein
VNPSSWAGVITATATVVTAIGGLVLAVSVLIPNLRASREVKKAVAEVHTIVNQQRTDSQRYQAALIKALQNAGIDVPDDQSLTDAPPKN